MFHKIFGQIFAAAGTVTGIVSNQDVNGLVFGSTIKPIATDYISVILKGGKDTVPEILLNRIPLLALAEISDIEAGASVGLLADQQGETGGVTMAGYFFRIDLGCLKNIANDSSLEVTLEMAGACTVGVYAFFNRDGVDRIKKYTVSSTLSQTFRDVRRMYAFTTATYVADFSSRVVSAMIRGGGQSFLTDLMGSVAGTYAVGNVKAIGPVQTILLYDGPEAIEDSVDVQLTGAGASTFSLIAVSILRNSARISRGNIASLGRSVALMNVKSENDQRAIERSGLGSVGRGVEVLNGWNIK